MAEVQLHPDWLARIGGAFEQPYMAALKQFLSEERGKGKAIVPRPRAWFAAVDATPPPDVRVGVVGHDPYHGGWDGGEVGEEGVRTGRSRGSPWHQKHEDSQSTMK